MYGKIKGLFTVAALAATAACNSGSPTEASFLAPPDEPMAARAESQLTFSSSQSYDTATPQTSTGGVGVIGFTGSLTTGNPCVDVTASHSSRSGSVTVTVTAAPNGSACIQVITNNNYQGQVSNLAPGTYTFTVVHDVGTRTTAHTSTVVVQ
ncbi:MAG TPA: hypothetical protein VF746_00225 [Longimicrobium sp.]|jgi:hypothetical protein